MEHLFSLDPFKGNLMYEGTGIQHQLFFGPGRPKEGHLRLVPQVAYDPRPKPVGDVLVLVRGPVYGRSGSGAHWSGGLVERRDDRPLRVGGGWLLRVIDPTVVRWARPSDRRVEGHCAAEKWFPPGAALIWADASSGAALLGTILDCSPEVIGEPVGEPIWLPTQRERWRLLARRRPDSYVILESAALRHGVAIETSVPPWAESPNPPEEVRYLASRLIQDEPAYAALERLCRVEYLEGMVIPRIDQIVADDPATAIHQLAMLLRGRARWTDREEWEALTF